MTLNAAEQEFTQDCGNVRGDSEPVSFVYFAYSLRPSGYLIKIGVSCDVKKRMVQLSHETRYPVSLLGKIQGGFAEEAALHELLKTARSEGEWFRPNIRVYSLLTEILQTSKFPECVLEVADAIWHELEANRRKARAIKAANAIVNTKGRTIAGWPCPAGQAVNYHCPSILPTANGAMQRSNSRLSAIAAMPVRIGVRNE
jgi:T5orf172 domain